MYAILTDVLLKYVHLYRGETQRLDKVRLKIQELVADWQHNSANQQSGDLQSMVTLNFVSHRSYQPLAVKKK